MMNRIIIIVLTALSLQGCVALVAGGAAAGGAVATDSRNVKTIASDKQITYQVQRHLVANQALQEKAHIVVATFNRVVLLAGQAPTAELRDEAVQITKTIPHVKRIFNEITIEQPTSPVVRSKDVAITANTKARMLATTNLKSNEFKIVTENGTVFLLGLTTREQAEVAATVARNSSGVKRVVKLIEYTEN